MSHAKFHDKKVVLKSLRTQGTSPLKAFTMTTPDIILYTSKVRTRPIHLFDREANIVDP
jgi:hypothetical protein